MPIRQRPTWVATETLVDDVPIISCDSNGNITLNNESMPHQSSVYRTNESGVHEISNVYYGIDTAYRYDIEGSNINLDNFYPRPKENKMVLDYKTLKTLKVKYSSEGLSPEFWHRYYSLKHKLKGQRIQKDSVDKSFYDLATLRQKIKEQGISRIYFKSKDYNVETYITLKNFHLLEFESRLEGYRYVLNRIKEKIQIKRRERFRDIRKEYNGFEYLLRGGVFIHEKTIKDLNDNWKIRMMDQNKCPKDNDDYLGIEIEFLSPYTPSNVKKEFIKNDLQNYVQLVEDGSVHPHDEDEENNNDYGHELRILVKESEFESLVPKICDILRIDLDAYSNETCGLHVHMDMRNKDYKLIFQKLVRMQGILFKLVDSSRRGNEFCEEVDDDDWNEVGYNHYHAICGPEAYSRHKTIEVRVHHGTVSKSKIINWINLLLRIRDNENIVSYIHSMDEARKVLNMEVLYA